MSSRPRPARRAYGLGRRGPARRYERSKASLRPNTHSEDTASRLTADLLEVISTSRGLPGVRLMNAQNRLVRVHIGHLRHDFRDLRTRRSRSLETVGRTPCEVPLGMMSGQQAESPEVLLVEYLPASALPEPGYGRRALIGNLLCQGSEMLFELKATQARHEMLLIRTADTPSGAPLRRIARDVLAAELGALCLGRQLYRAVEALNRTLAGRRFAQLWVADNGQLHRVL